MIIKGLQKLTLIDYPGRLAATVFVGGCNFRCPFCHNASLVLPEKSAEAIPEEEFFEFLSTRVGKLSGVCVSGGEPTVYPDLPDFIRRIRSLGFSVKLDTNGSSPDTLISLVKFGLVDYVAMDIKNSPERYAETVGKDQFDIAPICKSVEFLLSGAVDYEFRTTVVRELHTASNLAAVGKWISGAKRYYLQPFKDSGELISPGLTGYSEAEMNELLAIVSPFVSIAQIRG